MTSKRQQTMSKIAREREVRERRARKLEKKHAAAAERKANSQGATQSNNRFAAPHSEALGAVAPDAPLTAPPVVPH
jgi:hypothetical protein